MFVLPPYQRNFSKRLVNTPKPYFLDGGLTRWLVGIRSPEVRALHPSRGSSFETWVVGEFLRVRSNLGLPIDQYCRRDSNGLETDLIFEVGTGPHPSEIRSRQTATRDCLQASQASARFAGSDALRPWLVCGGNESYERSGISVIGWRDLASAVSCSPPTP